ncbi:MAG TPA: hypothetical protein VEZ18_10420, partial [Geodermatophilus sp.]|nr:hypothetical protein [Geodermatophilus sp.]
MSPVTVDRIRTPSSTRRAAPVETPPPKHRCPAPTGAPPSEEDPMRDRVVEPPGSHEPNEFVKTPKKAAASGW